MAVTREIPNTDWQWFLHRFGQRNLGRLVRLETMIPPGEGERLLAEHRPLAGVALETRGSESPSILVMLAEQDPQTPTFTHVIGDPTRLWEQEDVDGLARGLEIDSKGEGKTLLLFEPNEALPAHQ